MTGSLGTGTARFIFATLGGAITAWTPAAEATDSVVVATSPGAAYTGLTMISTPAGPELLAANFAQGRIDVFDSSFNRLDAPGLFHFFGFLRGENGRPVQIERLWALLPGTATTGATDAIWFSAGIGNEMHGLVGTFKAAP